MPTLSPSTLRIGHRYRSNRLQGPYDAIVIGSGMSGLTTAAFLSALGKKVLVLEQHYTAGGFTHSYSRNGYEWDVGVHYIGDMGYPTLPRKLFDWLTQGNLKWAPMDSHYDRFYFGEKQFDAVAGSRAYRDHLIAQFPAEKEAILTYFSLIREVSQDYRWLLMPRLFPTLPKPISGLLQPLSKRFGPRTHNRTTLDVLQELTSNPELIAVLCGQWGDYGLPPSQSSFVMHALVARHYLNGGYYPVGGSWKMAETIIPRIQASGGEVFTYARVESILVENDRVAGVTMADGEIIHCPTVISSAGVQTTFSTLLPRPLVQRLGYQEKLDQVTPSIGHVGLYIGLKGSAAEHQLPKTNLWIYPSTDYDGDLRNFLARGKDGSAPFPIVYVSFPSAKDPEFAMRHPDRSTIEVVAPAPYEWFAPWKNETWGKRGADYDAFKEQLCERLLEALFQKMPQLRGKIDYVEVSTPLSTEWFGNYQFGELYGINHDPSRFDQDWLKPKTRLPGLYLTGQDIVSCGVVGALMSGVLTSISIAGPLKMLPLLKAITGREH